MKNNSKIYFIAWLVFSVLMILAMMLIGEARNQIAFLPDQGFNWYYWQLPQIDNISRITGWSFFILHLITTLFLARKVGKVPFSEKLSKWHIALFFSQVFFIILHLVQTTFWYDSLVHDTPVWLSQFSVIIMLVMMLIILNQKRGLFFGKKLPIPQSVTKFFIDIHAPYIIVALVFTFWYHPMENTYGHLIGFFYMFMLFGQIIFASTKIHFNRIWVFLLEFTVLIHGTAIALQSKTIPSITPGKDMWPMFAFGFGAIAIITQIYLLKLPKWALILLNLVYLSAVILVYIGGVFSVRVFSQIGEITYIPFIEYLLVGVFVLLALLYLKLKGKFAKNQ